MHKINDILKNDGVISFVTDTVWGIGCLPTSEKAVDKIYEIKGRDRSKPLILMSNSLKHLLLYVENMSTSQKLFADKYFPGAVTLVMSKSEKTPDYITSGMQTVGIRVPDNSVFANICENIEGHVLATTSANLSNFPAAKNYNEAVEFIGDYVDYVVQNEEGRAKGLESTVVLLVNEEVKILRQGAVIIGEL